MESALLLCDSATLWMNEVIHLYRMKSAQANKSCTDFKILPSFVFNLLRWSCGEGGKPHGTSCVVTQGIGHEWLPPLGQFNICVKQTIKLRLGRSLLIHIYLIMFHFN